MSFKASQMICKAVLGWAPATETIERVVLGKLDVRQLLKNRPKPAPPSRSSRVPAAVGFNSQVSDSATLIEIVAEDRPGLLYDLASAISSQGCNIEVALVDTEGETAIDVFYLTRNGGKLDKNEERVLRRALMLAIEDNAR